MSNTETTTSDTVTPDYRADAVAGLAKLQTLRATVKELRAKLETDLALIEEALTKATAGDEKAIKELETALKALAVEQAEAIFGSASRLIQGGLALVLKESEAVETIGDEDDVIAGLKKAAKEHEDPAVRFAARSCLRIKYELNRQFVHALWEDYSPWFESFGLTVVERTSASIVEVKKKAPSASRQKKSAAGAGTPTPPPAEASTEGES